MRKLKYVKLFENFNFSESTQKSPLLEELFNKDNEIADMILSNLHKLKPKDIKINRELGWGIDDMVTFKFKLNEYKVSVTFEPEHPFDITYITRKYIIKVNGKEIDVSNAKIKKIFSKIKDLMGLDFFKKLKKKKSSDMSKIAPFF